jgi:acetylornithine deacetylase/succinyl-diaminopimelate desuccinylase-like protein
MLTDAIGSDLMHDVTLEIRHPDPATLSPLDTPLWDTLARTTKAFYADSAIIPMLMVGATDGRHFRRSGATAYGFGGFSRRMTLEDFSTMFHGNDERIDVDSLELSVALWEAVARDLLDPAGP